MLKQDLTLQTINKTDHQQKVKIKKVIGLMKDEVQGDHERICWIKS